MREVGKFLGMRVTIVDDLPSNAFMLIGARRWTPDLQQWEKHVVGYIDGTFTDTWLPELIADKIGERSC
jgi:hypothetical protein